MLLSLVLFGSRARGDHRLASDVDLLGVVEGGPIQEERSSHGTSFYRYPWMGLRAKSLDGDLFLLHLKIEGKVLHDTGQIFTNICEQFQYRQSYDREIREASAVIYYFVDHPDQLKSRAAKKRLVWGLRTVLIGRAAEIRKPSFSSSALAKFAGNEKLKSAIDNRFSIAEDSLRSLSEAVAVEFGVSRSTLEWPFEIKAQQELMTSLGGVARNTAEGLHRPKAKTATQQANTRVFYI